MSECIASVRRIHGKMLLTLESGETVAFPRALLRDMVCRTGAPFDENELAALMKTKAPEYALRRAVNLLAARECSKKQVADSLRRCAYPEPLIAQTLSKLSALGYVNDERFARAWVESRIGRCGPAKLRMDLRLKGIDSETVDALLAEYDEQTILSGAVKAAARAAKGKDPDDPKDRRNILAAVVRRGFSFSAAARALDLLREEQTDGE